MTDELVGRQLDEYRVERLLGQGGMARVYRALDVRLDRPVALKVIDVPYRAEADYQMRFEREARAIARLEHPNIVRLYRYGEASGLLYMAMQFVEGADLSVVLESYLADSAFIELENVYHIVRQVGEALDYAHSQGIIHRDVKPSNILLDRQGRAMLTDFGLALLVEIGTRGEIFGSPHYTAPEQAISSAGAVPLSDLYALGVVMYQMLTGQLPFDAQDLLDVAALHVTTPPPMPRAIRPELSPALEAVVLKALAKKPEQRFPTGVAFAAALNQVLQQTAVNRQGPPPTLVSRRTITERVVAELAAHPLSNRPGTPAGQSLPRHKPMPPAPELPAGRQKNVGFALALGVVMGLGALLLALVLVILLLPR